MKYDVVITNHEKSTVKTERYSNMMVAYDAECRVRQFVDFSGKNISVKVVEAC